MSYSSPGFAMLGYAVTASLAGTADTDIRSLLANRVMRPIGVADSEWDCGYEQTFTVDGLPLVPPWGGGNYSVSALVRVGRLALRQGNWDGTQTIGSAVVRAGAEAPGRVPGKHRARLVDQPVQRREPEVPYLPSDAFWAVGEQQVLLVVPSLSLIMVRYGEALASGTNETVMGTYLFAPLMEAIAG